MARQASDRPPACCPTAHFVRAFNRKGKGKSMKKFLAILLTGAMVLGLAACGSAPAPAAPAAAPAAAEEKTEEAAPAEAAEPAEGEERTNVSFANAVEATAAEKQSGEGVKLAISMNAMDEYQTEWFGYFKEIAEATGAEVIMTNAEGKVDKQLSDVEALIEQQPDVILIRSTDTAGAAPAFEACAAAGIPTIDSAFGSTYEDTMKIITAQYTLCAMQGEYCIQWMKDHPDWDKLYCGYIWGNQGQSSCQDRYDGWRETAEAGLGDKMEIVAEKVCNWDANETMKAVEDWVQAFPQMNCIVAMSDEMALAATNVLQAAGIGTDQCIVIGIDGSPAAQKAIREGTLNASVYTSKRKDAQVNVDYALDIAAGNLHKGENYDPGMSTSGMLTQDTIDEVLAELDG